MPQIIFAAALMVASVLHATGLNAAGAIAVGTTGDLSGDGVGVTGLTNKPDKATAIAEALRSCRKNADSRAAGSRCRIVATFSGQCFAFASARDPDAGGVGKGLVSIGWGVGPTKETATARAIAKCSATSPDATCDAGFSGCDAGDADAASGSGGGSWFAIAASKRTKGEALSIAARLGSPWSVKSSKVCSNYTQGLWVVVAGAQDRGAASALASQVGGYAKECL